MLTTIVLNHLGGINSQLCLAYIDPGSGSMILQIVLVGLAGVGVAFKYAGARILDIVWPFRRAKRADSDVSRPESSNDAGERPQVNQP